MNKILIGLITYFFISIYTPIALCMDPLTHITPHAINKPQQYLMPLTKEEAKTIALIRSHLEAVAAHKKDAIPLLLPNTQRTALQNLKYSNRIKTEIKRILQILGDSTPVTKILVTIKAVSNNIESVIDFNYFRNKFKKIQQAQEEVTQYFLIDTSFGTKLKYHQLTEKIHRSAKLPQKATDHTNTLKRLNQAEANLKKNFDARSQKKSNGWVPRLSKRVFNGIQACFTEVEDIQVPEDYTTAIQLKEKLYNLAHVQHKDLTTSFILDELILRAIKGDRDYNFIPGTFDEDLYLLNPTLLLLKEWDNTSSYMLDNQSQAINFLELHLTTEDLDAFINSPDNAQAYQASMLHKNLESYKYEVQDLSADQLLKDNNLIEVVIKKQHQTINDIKKIQQEAQKEFYIIKEQLKHANFEEALGLSHYCLFLDKFNTVCELSLHKAEYTLAYYEERFKYNVYHYKLYVKSVHKAVYITVNAGDYIFQSVRQMRHESDLRQQEFEAFREQRRSIDYTLPMQYTEWGKTFAAQCAYKASQAAAQKNLAPQTTPIPQLASSQARESSSGGSLLKTVPAQNVSATEPHIFILEGKNLLHAKNNDYIKTPSGTPFAQYTFVKKNPYVEVSIRLTPQTRQKLQARGLDDQVIQQQFIEAIRNNPEGAAAAFNGENTSQAQDFFNTTLAYIQAAPQGVVDGVNQTAADLAQLIEHPVEIIQDIATTIFQVADLISIVNNPLQQTLDIITAVNQPELFPQTRTYRYYHFLKQSGQQAYTYAKTTPGPQILRDGVSFITQSFLTQKISGFVSRGFTSGSAFARQHLSRMMPKFNTAKMRQQFALARQKFAQRVQDVRAYLAQPQPGFIDLSRNPSRVLTPDEKLQIASAVEIAAEAEREAIRQSIFASNRNITIDEMEKLGFRGKSTDYKKFNKNTGHIRLHTELEGGMAKVEEMLDSLKNEFSGRKLIGEKTAVEKNGVLRITYQFEDGSTIQLRTAGKSGQPKIDIDDRARNIYEKITFKEPL